MISFHSENGYKYRSIYNSHLKMNADETENDCENRNENIKEKKLRRLPKRI